MCVCIHVRARLTSYLCTLIAFISTDHNDLLIQTCRAEYGGGTRAERNAGDGESGGESVCACGVGGDVK